MKKKLLILALMALVMCLFAVSAFAAEPDATKGSVTLSDGTVCPLYDADGNALVWYKSTTNADDGYASYDYVRADGGNGEEGYTGGKVVYKATYQFSSKTNNKFERTKNAIALYEVSEMWIVDASGSKVDKGNIVVFNMKDDDVKVNEASNAAYLDKPVNCLKNVFWANKIVEYIYLRSDIGALQANAINGCDKLKYINFEELVNLRQIAGSGLANNPSLFANGTLDLSKTAIVDVGGSGANSNGRYAELILPETLVSIGDYPFEKNPNLKKVTFNSPVSSASGSNHFYNCTSLETVIGFENLTITTLNKGFFGNCSSLKSIKLPETLTSIGQASFEASGLTEITIPNGVTSIGQNAFQGCKSLKVIRLSASCDTLVNYDSFKNCSALEAIYVPASITSIPINEFNASADNFVFYFTGTKAQLDALKENTHATGNGAFDSAYANAISAEDFAKLENPTGKYAVYGYNKCDAFYGGVDVVEGSNDCTKEGTCTRCGRAFAGQSAHSLIETLTFANGFTADGIYTCDCTNDGCTVADVAEKTVSAIFSAKGYSTNDAKNSINGGYTVNLDSLALYKRLNGEIKYGVVIANAKSFDGEFFDSDNKVNSAKALQVEIDSQYSNFDCSILFGSAANADLNLVICAYVITDDGVVFIQKDSGSDVTIGGATFKSVTLASVVALVPAPASKEI